MDEPKDNPPPSDSRATRELLGILGVFGAVLLVIYAVFAALGGRKDSDASPGLPKPVPPTAARPPVDPDSAPVALNAPGPTNQVSKIHENIFDPQRRALYWWREFPRGVREGSIDSGAASNIRPADYIGSQSCAECHATKHEDWMGHSHRLMNALATPKNVVGDFSGDAEIRYLGGVGRFYREGDRFLMSLERGGTKRVYGIERTIGSRFTQYYVGRLIEGPEPADSRKRSEEHVLPFGYWMEKKEWAPTVHVFRDSRKDDDAFDPYIDNQVVAYDEGCADCHTTIAAGDWLMRSAGLRRISKYSPRSILFDVPGYLEDTKPEFLKVSFADDLPLDELLDQVDHSFNNLDIREHAVSLGITCESCHLGCRQHVENSDKEKSAVLPYFFPAGEQFFSLGRGRSAEQLGRIDENLNFTCAKCHSGKRPNYASGHDTWNSTEYSDAIAGACYDKRPGSGENRAGMRHLTCVDCHDPHKGIGRKWPRTPTQDDESCAKCHEKFSQPAAVAAHTHHEPGTAGSRCMNCHMPKINEGLQGMVRTHRIFSPTEKTMIEANQPNACNLCHLDKPIDWTVKHLREWYGGKHVYDEAKLAANYPDRQGKVGLGWLKSGHAPTRLSAAWAFTHSKADWAMDQLLEGLNDDHLVNRQFLQIGLDQMLGIRLKDKGYQYYMQAPERRAAIDQLKASRK